MLKLYSPKKAERILEKNADWIGIVSRRYAVPAACVKAVLRKELAEIDLLDLVADLMVRLNWLRFRIRRFLFRRDGEQRGGQIPAGRHDSSTGYAQIFGYVAIDAANYALARGLEEASELGLPEGCRPDSKSADDLCSMWHRLAGDKKYNIRLGTLNLIAAAEEMNGHTDFSRYTPEEFQRAFTRYNANVRHITDYGREVYGYYLRYSEAGNTQCISV